MKILLWLTLHQLWPLGIISHFYLSKKIYDVGCRTWRLTWSRFTATWRPTWPLAAPSLTSSTPGSETWPLRWVQETVAREWDYTNYDLQYLSYLSVFRIRMDPGFFANPDPDFKNPDPDPSINKPMRSKWCFWLGFEWTWPKRTVLRVLNVK